MKHFKVQFTDSKNDESHTNMGWAFVENVFNLLMKASPGWEMWLKRYFKGLNQYWHWKKNAGIKLPG